MSEEINKNFGNYLKEVRKLLQFNQKEAAAELGISQPTLSQIESGNTNITVSDYIDFLTRYERLSVLKGKRISYGDLYSTFYKCLKNASYHEFLNDYFDNAKTAQEERLKSLNDITKKMTTLNSEGIKNLSDYIDLLVLNEKYTKKSNS